MLKILMSEKIILALVFIPEIRLIERRRNKLISERGVYPIGGPACRQRSVNPSVCRM